MRSLRSCAPWSSAEDKHPLGPSPSNRRLLELAEVRATNVLRTLRAYRYTQGP